MNISGTSANPATLELSNPQPRIDIIRRLFLLSVITASFDVFLAMNVSGFTLRAQQLLLVLPLFYVLGQGFSNAKIELPVGAPFLYIWIVFIVAFVPHTSLLMRSAGYAVWLLLDVAVILVTVQLFNDERWLKVLLRWYMLAFLVAAAIGLLQLVMGLCHLPVPFVRQWLIGGMWPRLNGASYEPSYFATYLLMGWVFCAWTIERDQHYLPPKLVRITFVVCTVAILLSTSRLGWAFMGLWSGLYLLRRLLKWRPVTMGLGAWVLLVNFALVAMGGFATATALGKMNGILQFFAVGTGLFGTAAHSSDERMSHTMDTLELVKNSPFIGYSLGGVASAIRELKQNAAAQGNQDVKQFEGNSIFLEVLAASGVIGFIPFVAYVVTLLLKPSLLAMKTAEPTRTMLSGLVWALVMELLILQFNQNILRPYLWFHIGVLSAAYAVIRSREAASSRVPAPSALRTLRASG